MWRRYGLQPLLSVAVMVGAGHALAAGKNHGRLAYEVRYRVVAEPEEQRARVELELRQDRYLLREMRFDRDRVSDLEGDGELVVEDGRVTWRPPEEGGVLSWIAEVPHERNGDGYDAWLDGEWGLFRAEDVIPRAATRTLKGARSDSRFRVRAPDGWSVVTQYKNNDEGSTVRSPGRRFSQPTGWIVMGELGVRRDRIADTRVVVAAPQGQGTRRVDMLALLAWTLPELDQILPGALERLTIVSAGEPMWRGALSAPSSIYIHADRPLISENGTSTLAHEVLHAAIGLGTEPGYDWITEGFAEYYSLELLKRSGTLTRSRHQHAMARLRDWSESAKTLCRKSSNGATTARAVMVLADLDREIREATGGHDSLDDVLRALVESGRDLDLERLADAAGEVMDAESEALDADHLPGCD